MRDMSVLSRREATEMALVLGNTDVRESYCSKTESFLSNIYVNGNLMAKENEAGEFIVQEKFRN